MVVAVVVAAAVVTAGVKVSSITHRSTVVSFESNFTVAVRILDVLSLVPVLVQVLFTLYVTNSGNGGGGCGGGGGDWQPTLIGSRPLVFGFAVGGILGLLFLPS